MVSQARTHGEGALKPSLYVFDLQKEVPHEVHRRLGNAE